MGPHDVSHSHSGLRAADGARKGLGMYAAMLDPTAASATISKAPVISPEHLTADKQQHEDSANERKQPNAALRFQPTKRPQASSQKVKPKFASTNTKDSQIEGEASHRYGENAKATGRSTLENWTTKLYEDDLDDEGNPEGSFRRPRGGRKRRKQAKADVAVQPQDWNGVYDPLRPNRYEDYKQSEERDREMFDWRQRLMSYRGFSNVRDGVETEDLSPSHHPLNHDVPNIGFAPPADLDNHDSVPSFLTDQPTYRVLDDPTGEDAYARRLRMSGAERQEVDTTHLLPTDIEDSASSIGMVDRDVPVTSPTVINPGQSQSQNLICRAPVVYSSLTATLGSTDRMDVDYDRPQDNDETPSGEIEADIPRSSRPGQRGFAERMMAKQGWKKGSGLGAEGAGMKAPLHVQLEKRKKRSDAEGGGWIGPAGRGHIVQKQKPNQQSSTKESEESDVVVLQGLMKDPPHDTNADENYVQHLGDELTQKCGIIERIFLHHDSHLAFVKFSSRASAIRAVQILDGSEHEGRQLTAKFYSAERFERGIYQ